MTAMETTVPPLGELPDRLRELVECFEHMTPRNRARLARHVPCLANAVNNLEVYAPPNGVRAAELQERLGARESVA